MFLSFFALRQAQDKLYVYPGYSKEQVANHSLSRFRVQENAQGLTNLVNCFKLHLKKASNWEYSIWQIRSHKTLIEFYKKQGYQYIYIASIAPDLSACDAQAGSETSERQSFEDVLLLERLQSAVGRIKLSIPADVREDTIKQILRFNSPELIKLWKQTTAGF